MADRRRKSGVVNIPLDRENNTQQDPNSKMGSGAMGKAPKEKPKKKPKERWLLTRKTWRYMADAGRKLIPEGALNRPEDVPKIEAYFQEVCQKEPRFLLWRKGSYPGALGFRSNRRRKERRKGGSCRTKSCSADEADDIKKATRPTDLALISHSSGGRFDIQKLKYDFLNKPPPATSPTSSGFHRLGETLASMKEEESEETQLINMLEKYLTISEKGPAAVQQPGAPAFDYQELIDKLQQHLSTVYKTIPKTPSPSTSRKVAPKEGVHFEGDHVQKSLSETLSRYFSRSTNREHVISDLLTNRKLLEGLYFDLRRTKGFRSNRTGAGNYSSQNLSPWGSSSLRHSDAKYDADSDSDSLEIGGWKRLGHSVSKFRKDGGPMSPPPLIEIRGESQEQEPTYIDWGIQTDPIPEGVLQQCDEEYKKAQAEKEQEIREQKSSGYRRRSSVDNDDVSPSVSDTIKRYLRMARKKSVDSDKAVDRFKRVNYDRNLRNIKAKGEITKPGDDDGLNKGCQTVDEWILTYRDLKFDEIVFSDPETSVGGSRVTSSRSSYDATTTGGEDVQILPVKPSSCPASPPSGFLSSSQSFLSNLLHGSKDAKDAKSAAAQAAAVMQKSKSSSSVMHHGSRLVAKKIFRSRSKSQSRVQATPSTWTPQGNCTWNNVTGRQVTLQETSLLHLSDIERRVLQKVALAKLQALNLGVAVRVPCETAGQTVQKSKRRAYLIKRKAKTTGFFDTGRKDDKDKDGNSTTGLVFGIPLSQCLENDRLSRIARAGSPFRSRGELSGSGDDTATLRRQSHHGSRASFSSLIDSPRTEESGSCESLMSRERILGSVPGLLDSISCGSTTDIASATAAEEEPGVPNMVQACLRYLEAYGLHTTGIFRVSSSKKRVRQLREDFDCGKETTLDEEQCPHDVATLLKEYLRDLPDPLLCRDLYHAFVLTQRIRNRRLQLEAIQHLIQLLPVPNRDTLSALLVFLASVARHSNDTKDSSGEWMSGNKMDSNNLATVFAPNILHCVKQSSSSKDVSIDRPEDRIDVINVIRSMIDHHKQLFIVSAELLDEIYVHMMDSHPEALDALLNKRDSQNISDADLIDDGESESSSAPWTPTTNTEMALDPALIALQQHSNNNDDGRHTPPEPRKTYSREEFLHENAGTGGPNVDMRWRYRDRDRGRDRHSKKRWRDDSVSRKISNDPSALSSAMTIITRFRSGNQSGEDPISSQTRSSSVDSTNSVQNDGNDMHARLLRVSSDDRRQSSPLLLDNSGVITASLKIPVQTTSSNQNQNQMALSVDDSDIPYVDDGSSGIVYLGDSGKQQMTIGVIKGPSAPPRRRQRSVSGSDSSQASNIIQPITGSISVIQQGYDSAMGSSTTFSSPPHNTAPSSVGSSITGDAGVYSSPPSWASSPPTSPDSVHTSVNYIPDDPQPPVLRQRSIPITQKLQIDPMGKDSTSPILQKVSFTSTSELQQIKQQPKHIDIQQYHQKQQQKELLPKSASTTSVIVQKTEIETVHPVAKEQQKAPASISSIGGAVLRSKTADFERMLRLGGKTETKTKQIVSTTTTTTTTTSEKKKYTKRRYTDSRHDTRHIPDSETLDKAVGTTDRKKETTNSSSSMAAAQSQVYKRRELIASVPKDRHSIL